MTPHEYARDRRETDFDHTGDSVPADAVRRIFADMREHCPVAHSDRHGGFDYISRYQEVRRILADSTTFSTTDGVFLPPSGLPRVPPLEYDPPMHTVLRAVMDGPPTDDYLSALASGEIDGRQVDAEFVTGIMSAFMLGGHHSTATAIAGLLRLVLPNPKVREQSKSDDHLLARAIEESLRLTTPLSLFGRTVRCDTEVGGVSFGRQSGRRNRDPRQFVAPETFDANRPHNTHVAFGRGLHTCSGQHLARAEMRIVSGLPVVFTPEQLRC